ncbi:polyprenyl synthetase family protein [Proteinivorax hydrogeniformans]|uniref:Farnesyl diphosphate synthase n=1 Tax=Proteinivorax hydrogeniformans TaxID=1826727 RepID=A0AAU8HR40_9FIRM
MDLKQGLAQYKEIIDNNITRFIPENCPPKLKESMEYSLKAGGKRIRPALLLMVCDHYKVSRELSLPVACSIEYIHTYSLIHDDLPAMDDDDFRRGKPTNHKVFGEAIAILAGDGILNTAFEILSNLEGIDPKIQVKLIKELSVSAGITGMIKGQILDIEGEEKQLTSSQLADVHRYKTGKLLTAPLKMAASLSKLDKETAEALYSYGDHFGMAFQITDDILDVCGSFESLGKAVGSDEKLSKSTYVTLHGLDKAKLMAKEHVQQGIKELEDNDIKVPYLPQLLTYLLNRKA